MNIFIVSFFLIIFLILYLILRKFKLSQLNDARETYDTYIPIYENVFEDFRKLNHDFVNHLATLKVLQDDSLAFESYKKEIQSHFDWETLSQIEDPILMMYVNTWKSRFKDKKILLSIVLIEERGTWMVSLNKLLETLITHIKHLEAYKKIEVLCKKNNTQITIKVSIPKEFFDSTMKQQLKSYRTEQMAHETIDVFISSRLSH